MLSVTLQRPTEFVILTGLVAAVSTVYCAVLVHDVLDNLNCGCKESEQKIEDSSDTLVSCVDWLKYLLCHNSVTD